jgi:predicted XRE-type DNA-binding protein
MKKPYYTKEEANQANKNWYKKYNHRNLLHQWDEIKNEPNAIKIDDEVGYLKTSLWIEKQGFTLSQVGSFLGVSRQRVLQLIQKKSHRIEKAIEIMRSTP